ncbi:hypothetical protein [Herbidospora mongoliensis]|uniref:hypothetical protein n=1 Tax=Herbidospora mongoliensis TaxID=688067 RepID=UPI000A7E7EA7|nr:hypothetical protein [Herbidospora mongoliensis]
MGSRGGLLLLASAAFGNALPWLWSGGCSTGAVGLAVAAPNSYSYDEPQGSGETVA